MRRRRRPRRHRRCRRRTSWPGRYGSHSSTRPRSRRLPRRRLAPRHRIRRPRACRRCALRRRRRHRRLHHRRVCCSAPSCHRRRCQPWCRHAPSWRRRWARRRCPRVLRRCMRRHPPPRQPASHAPSLQTPTHSPAPTHSARPPAGARLRARRPFASRPSTQAPSPLPLPPAAALPTRLSVRLATHRPVRRGMPRHPCPQQCTPPRLRRVRPRRRSSRSPPTSLRHRQCSSPLPTSAPRDRI